MTEKYHSDYVEFYKQEIKLIEPMIEKCIDNLHDLKIRLFTYKRELEKLEKSENGDN